MPQYTAVTFEFGQHMKTLKTHALVNFFKTSCWLLIVQEKMERIAANQSCMAFSAITSTGPILPRLALVSGTSGKRLPFFLRGFPGDFFT